MAQRQWRSDDTDKWKHAFGNGANGSSYSTPANEGCSGASGGKSLTLAAAGSFSNGDLVLIHQSRGTGAGNWELNKIISGAGTTSLTMESNLTNTYADSGNSQAQIIELNQYDGLTISTTITVPAWDGSKGGIIAFLDKGTTSGSSGILSLNGASSSNNSTPSGGGFRGGSTTNGTGGTANQGESSTGAGGASTSANGAGGGGGSASAGTAGGGGAGHSTSGQNGTADAATGGTGGGTDGGASLVDCVMGAAGGGGRRDYGSSSAGGNGGGIAFIFSKDLNLSSLTVRSNGGNSANVSGGPGGAGAGGSILFKCQTATLGSSKATATGGTGGTSTDKPVDGGDGRAGRIHIDYSKSYTGTTNPTINATLDTTIKAGGPNFFAFF